jgi:hypothetical protein
MYEVVPGSRVSMLYMSRSACYNMTRVTDQTDHADQEGALCVACFA